MNEILNLNQIMVKKKFVNPQQSLEEKNKIDEKESNEKVSTGNIKGRRFSIYRSYEIEKPKFQFENAFFK